MRCYWKRLIRAVFLPLVTMILCCTVFIYGKHAEEESVGKLYTTTHVNFRTEPEINSNNVIKVLQTNTEVQYYTSHTENEWTRCKYNNETGWIYSQYLSKDKQDYEYLGRYRVTGYRMFSAAENGGRSDGRTASGVIGQPGRTVAMKGIAFGTKIYIDGLGEYVVEDRGVGYGVVDVACWTKEECYKITGWYDVYIIN